MGVNNGCGLEGILARLRNPLKRTGLAIALAAGLLGSTIAKAEWAPPTDLVELNSGSGEQMGSLSSDGLTLYFSHDETGGDVDIWYATRPDTNSPWATRMPVIEVNTPAIDDRPVIANDGNTLYFHSNSGGNWDIYYAIRSDSSSPFSAPQQLNEVNSPAVELMGALSCDGRTIYFSSDRIGGMGSGDIYAATRIDTSSPFGSPLNLTEVNSSDYDSGDSISADDLELYITRQPPDTNNTDVYRATRADPS
ncbi:MAG TPA: hypothetical protein VJK52_04675, partial [Candidatus Nanoarchaeia archaeon]|nr:hypothetical protein [Candidatus Nanoarchaeia archaeon]